MNLTEFFKSKGYNTTEKDNWDKYLYLWNSWYKGNVKSFHNYQVYNGMRKVGVKRKSLQMAKKLCEDWADLLFNEKVKITTDNDTANEQLEEIFTQNDLWVICNQMVEKTFATGTCALVEDVKNYEYNDETGYFYPTEDTKVRIQVVTADKIYPLSWENGNIKECAFVNNIVKNGNTYTIVNMHTLNEIGNYVINNYIFLNENDVLTPVQDLNVQDTFDTKSNIKWFQINKPNICNNIKEDSPFGISVFANNINILETLDIIFDGIPNEFLLGRKRIFVDKDLTHVDTINGNIVNTFDMNDLTFYALPSELNGENTIGIKDNTQQLRVDEHVAGIEVNLNLLSDKSGFGKGYYKFEDGNVSTATQVISENSKLFRTLKKHEIILESTLFDLVEAVSYIGSTFGTYNIQYKEIKVDFDDSIIEDKQAERNTDRADVSMGAMSLIEYRMKWYNETLEEAQKNLPQQMEGIEDEVV